MTLLSRYAHGFVRHRLIIAIVLASAVGVALTSRDLFMTPIAAATLAGIAVVGLQRVCRSRPWSDWKHIRTAQTLSIVAVPLAFTTGLSVDRAHLFHEAFGTPVPAGCRDLTIDANLLNPAGKRTVLMRFNAEQSTMSVLLADATFRHDPQMEEARAAQETWDNMVSQAFSEFGRFGGQAWSMAAMSAPEFRHRQRTADGVQMETRVLWDSATGEAFVLYTVR